MESVAEYFEPFFDLLKSEPRRKIMMALHAAHVLFEEYGITTTPDGKTTIVLDKEGKRLYRQMQEYGGINYAKLEGHYEPLVEVIERRRQIKEDGMKFLFG